MPADVFAPSTRRSLLRAALVGLGAVSLPVLQACGQASPPSPSAATPKSSTAQSTAKPTNVATSGAATTPAAATPAAGAKPAGRGGAKITLIGSSDSRPWFEYVGKQYHDATGGSLQLITQAYDQTHNKIVTAIAGGSSVDVVTVDTIWGAEFADAGFLTPIDQRLTKEITASLVPHALDPWSYKGHQWAVPVSYYFKFYYYNTEILQKGGISAPPKTYEDLVDVSKQLIDKKLVKYGQSWGWTQAEGLICDWQQLMLAFGGNWWDKSGQWSFNQGGAVQALDYMVSNLKSKVFDPASSTLTDRTTMNVFARGDTAFMTNWGFAWSAVNDTKQSKVAGKVKLTINPGTKVAKVVSTSCGGGGGFGITPNSKAKDDAWTVVGLITSITKPENDLPKLKMIGAPPVHEAMWHDPKVLQEEPQFAEMIKQAPYMRHRPVLPWYTDFSKIVQIELTKAFSGEKAPQKALDDAVAAVKAKGNPPTG